MSVETFKYQKQDNVEKIFDPVRKKYVVLTPEEWVRQQILQYFILTLKIPSTLISVEKQLLINNRKRRYDIVVYSRETPWLVVECKAENEELSSGVLSQLLAYNSKLKASYLAITNGKEVFCYHVEVNKWFNTFPSYKKS